MAAVSSDFSNYINVSFGFIFLLQSSNICFSSLRPVIVEPFEQLDDMDGYSEKGLFKKTPEFYKEREVCIFELFLHVVDRFWK